jgi:hypothetical protein
MASALSSAINAIKYAKVHAKQSGAWSVIHEAWAKSGTWKEPSQIWVKTGGVWERATTPVRYVKFNGSSSYFDCNQYYNNYISGASTTYYEFSIILTSTSTVQTLFSYGSATDYCTIEVGTDGKVYVKTRYDSGSAYSFNHATALSLNTFYLIRVEFVNASTGYIRIRNVSGGAVGVDYSSGNIASILNTSIKYIGKKYNSTNYFSGYLMDVNMFGGHYGGTDYRHDSNSLASSTIGSNAIVDSYTADGTQNLTGYNVVVATTG